LGQVPGTDDDQDRIWQSCVERSDPRGLCRVAQRADRRLPKLRASRSCDPPAGLGTRKRIGLTG
jgi:hypothetical protein